MSPTTRRVFLKESLAATSVLTLPFLVRADEEPMTISVGEAVAAALQRMKEENKPGLVIVLPDAAEEAQSRLQALSVWLGGGEMPLPGDEERPKLPPSLEADAGASVRQLLCQAVLVCVPRAELPKRWALQETTWYAVVDSDGNILAESAATEKPERLTPVLTELLHGPRGQHLAAYARRQRTALGERRAVGVVAALRNLDAADFETREEANELLRPLAGKIPAVLAEVLAGKPALELRRRVEALFDEVYSAAPNDKPGIRQPFGTRWSKTICALRCGLACPSPSARLFLRAFTEVKP